MRILLTGCAGFIGSNIAERLLDEIRVKDKYYVAGIDDFSFGDKKNLPKNLYFINIDFNDIKFDFLESYDILIHCATSNIIYSIDNPIETFRNNSKHTINLFKKFSGKIIYLSSCSVYSPGTGLKENSEIKTSNAYDTSKHIAEQFLQCRGNYTTLRLSNVYGRNQLPSNTYCGVVGRYIDNALKKMPLEIYGNGNDTRDYTFVDDVVNAVMFSINQEAKNTEINIGTGIETSVLELITLIESILGYKLEEIFIEERVIDKIKHRSLNIEKAKELLVWQPKTYLKEGLEKTIEWQTVNKYIN